ncbi:MAG: class I SAM-dependent methyltransferase [Acidobacteria bacterium]|nr:class I SAM-dependent methyltransferase [Acidobacteriota bacterium]
MNNILAILRPSQVAVDLGCGGGSFQYASYQCRIIGMDVAFNRAVLYRDGNRVQYVQSQAAAIPLASASVDAVICNHTFEHFPDYKHVLSEINRALKPTGMLWIAIPNGYGFDDTLYRFLFKGGGHVNRFGFHEFVAQVHAHSDLKLIQWIPLFSGFVYLQKPNQEQLIYFPDSARWLFTVPEFLRRAAILTLNAATRLFDKLLGMRISQYGWGFVFARGNVDLPPLPVYFNVCWKCGSGNSVEYLKASGRVERDFGIRFYSCSNCNEKNVLVNPPSGLS